MYVRTFDCQKQHRLLESTTRFEEFHYAPSAKESITIISTPYTTNILFIDTTEFYFRYVIVYFNYKDSFIFFISNYIFIYKQIYMI